MNKKGFFTKAVAVALAFVMAICALPNIGSLAQRSVSGPATFEVSDKATVTGDDKGTITLDKYAYLTGNGTYNIELSAFVTGDDLTAETVTVTEQKPVDIVIVVDQSGSMNDGWGTGSGYGHLTATKNAVKTFIESLAATGMDHRVSIVGFSNGLDAADDSYTSYEKGIVMGYDEQLGEEVVFQSNNDFNRYYRFRGTGVFVNGSFYRYVEEGYETNVENGEVWVKYERGKAPDQISGNSLVCVCSDAGLADSDQIYVDSLVSVQNSKSELIASAEALNAYEGTMMSWGLKMAKRVIDVREDKSNPALVVLFTDGVPGNTGFSMTEAKDTVDAANAIKADDAKIITVGLVANEYFSQSSAVRDNKNPKGFARNIMGVQEGTAATQNERYLLPMYEKTREVHYNDDLFTKLPKFNSQNWSSCLQPISSSISTPYYDVWKTTGYSWAIPEATTRANYTAAGLEVGFLWRDLLSVVSSDNEGIEADLYTMQEMYDTFSKGAAPNDNMSGQNNVSLASGYLWPIYTVFKAATSTDLASYDPSYYFNIGKCIAYHKDGKLIAGDYLRVVTDGFTYDDGGIAANAHKYYINAGHDVDAAGNEELLNIVFESIETIISEDIITSGGGHPENLNGSTVLMDQISDLFTFKNADITVRAYTENYRGIVNDKHSFFVYDEFTPETGSEITDTLMISFDESTGKIAVCGFDYSKNHVYMDNTGDTPAAKGCRLRVVVEGILAKENTVGFALPTNIEETSGLYPGAGQAPTVIEVTADPNDPEGTVENEVANPNYNPGTNPGTEGSGIIPGSSDRPGEYPVNDGRPLIFPLPMVDIEEELIVYDFSTTIMDAFRIDFPIEGVECEIVSFADPFVKIDPENVTTSLNKDFDSITLSAGSENDGEFIGLTVGVKAISDEVCGSAALVRRSGYNVDQYVDGRTYPRHKWYRITVLPATNVHYEETYLKLNADSGKTYCAAWNVEGAEGSDPYANANPVYNVNSGEMVGGGTFYQESFNYLYGFDFSYMADAACGDSNTTSAHVHVGEAERKLVNDKTSPQSWPTANFTFTGTGFDVIGRAGMDTGVYVVNIENADGSFKKGQIVNSRYYGSENAGAPGNFGSDLRQVPLVHIVSHNGQPLPYDTYNVELSFVWMPGLAMAPAKGAYIDIPGIPEADYELIGFDLEPAKAYTYNPFDVYVDAIRVYNPIDPDKNSTAMRAYADSLELYPTYTEVRDIVINGGSIAAEGENGAIAIDITPHSAPVHTLFVQKLNANGKPLYENGEPVYEQLTDDAGNPVYENGKPVYKPAEANTVLLDENGKPVMDFVMPQDGSFTDLMEAYRQYGPNNEMYLMGGQGFAFKLDSEYLSTVNAAHGLHISAKTPNADADMMLLHAYAIVDNVQTAVKTDYVSSATEMFYDFTELLMSAQGGSEVYIVFAAEGSDILSICQLKSISDSNPLTMVSDPDAIEIAAAVMAGTKGDVNADAGVDMIDGLLAMREVLASDTLTAYGRFCGDVNNSGSVDIMDALEIMRKSLGN